MRITKNLIWATITLALVFAIAIAASYLLRNPSHELRNWPSLRVPPWAEDVEAYTIEMVPNPRLVLWHRTMTPILNLRFFTNDTDYPRVFSLLKVHLEAQGYAMQSGDNEHFGIFLHGDYQIHLFLREPRGDRAGIEINMDQTMNSYNRQSFRKEANNAINSDQ